MPKKIVLVANTSWNIHHFRSSLLEALEEHKISITVLAPADAHSVHLYNRPHLRYIPLNRLNRRGMNPFKEWSAIGELKKRFREEAPDLIIQFTIKPNIYGSLAAADLGIPVVSVVTGLGYTFLHNGWLQWFVKRLYRLAFRSNTRVIFENKEDRLYFTESGLVDASKAVSIRGCGVNTRTFAPVTEEEPSPPVFLFLGRFLHDKGIVEFVEAARRLKYSHPTVRCVLVGAPDPGNPASISALQLEQWLEEDLFEYKGFQEQVQPFIKAATAVVLPSYREAIPRALTEAMAMAKPVITTDTPGCREAVTQGVQGYLVPVKDATALYEAMVKMLALQPAARKEMGRQGRLLTVRHFDDRLIADALLRIIGEAHYVSR